LPELGTATAFSLIESHSEAFKELAAAWEAMSDRVARLPTAASLPDLDAFTTIVKQEVYIDMSVALSPLRALFSKQSTHINSPGDRIEAELVKMRQELVRLNTILQQQSIPAAAGPMPPTGTLAWGIGGALGASGAAIPGVIPVLSTGGQVINPDIQKLERKILRLERLLDARSVKIGSVNFSSRQEAEAWLKTHCTNAGGYTFFVDFHNLLALAFGPGGFMADILKLHETSVKLSDATTDEAIVVASFHMEIPSFFGKPSATATTHSAKVLPGLQTYAAWDSGDGDHGLRYDMKQKVKELCWCLEYISRIQFVPRCSGGGLDHVTQRTRLCGQSLVLDYRVLYGLPQQGGK
jgi:hypothetical protein